VSYQVKPLVIPMAMCLIVAYTGQEMDVDINQTRPVSFLESADIMCFSEF